MDVAGRSGHSFPPINHQPSTINGAMMERQLGRIGVRYEIRFTISDLGGSVAAQKLLSRTGEARRHVSPSSCIGQLHEAIETDTLGAL
jgi:hypothetical protein